MNRKSTTQATIAKRSGQALVEFAIISFVLTAMLMGFLGLIVMGLGSFQNNIAAESTGRVLDQHPRLSASAFGQVFGDNTINPYTATASQVMELLTYDDPTFNAAFGAPLYHDRHLVLSPDEWANRQELPALNQRLTPSYVYDPDVVPGEAEDTPQGAYRYPGAVVKRTVGTETYQTVLIPLLDITGVEPCNDADCQCESDYWVAPLRICKILDCDCDADPPVATNPIGSEPTFVISIVYPSQPSSLLNIDPERDEDGHIVLADAVPDSVPDPTGYDFDETLSPNPDFNWSPSRGKYGLGVSFALGQITRPYRRVFETRSVFRLRFGATAAKYEAEGTVIDLADADDQDDQFLNFGQQVIDREPAENSLVIPDDPPVPPFNDFLYRALVVPATSDGLWRVSVAAEFQPEMGTTWMEGHALELRLYCNDEFRQLIAAKSITRPVGGTVSPPVTGTAERIQLLGQGVIDASAGDIIQVRVYSARPFMQMYKTQLTGVPERNWITYEFLNTR